jgi:hypothetical protein
MPETKSALTVHVTIHPDKHPAVYAALVSVEPRARSYRLSTISEAAFGGQLGSSRTNEPSRPVLAGTARAPSSPVDELGSLLGMGAGAAG